MADEMDVDVEQPKTKGKKEGKDSGKPRFEVKKVSFHCNLTPPAWAGTLCRFGHGVRTLSLSNRCVAGANPVLILRHRRR
jgi:hypothetical protein